MAQDELVVVVVVAGVVGVATDMLSSSDVGVAVEEEDSAGLSPGAEAPEGSEATADAVGGAVLTGGVASAGGLLSEAAGLEG